MATLLTHPALAYVYHGDWVADCPRNGCGNVEFLGVPMVKGGPRVILRSEFHCSYCTQLAEILYPPQLDEIMAVLSRRPIPHTRNWYPKNHETAVKFRVEHGQSVAELMEENAAHGVGS